MKNLWNVGPSDIPMIYLNVGDQRTRMGWANFRLQLHTAVTSCPGWPGTGSPATNAGVDKMKAEIQNQYLLHVLLLEVSLSLTSLKCFWLEAAEDTGLLLTQILSTPFVDLACTVTQNIDVKA